MPNLDSFAIKISQGFFDNPKLGLASVNGLMVLFSSRTGFVEALFLDNGYLTDVRTAAAGAVAAKYLAREDACVATVYGAGVQAGLQLEVLMLVRSIAQARIWALDPAKALLKAEELSDWLGIPVTAVEDTHEASAGADILITTTPAETPVLMSDWLEAG